jgi:hypothetical protein
VKSPSRGAESCALCHYTDSLEHADGYNEYSGHNGCEGCPVYEHTGQAECEGTPYYNFRDASTTKLFTNATEHWAKTPEAIEKANEMYEFLVELLPTEKRQNNE